MESSEITDEMLRPLARRALEAYDQSLVMLTKLLPGIRFPAHEAEVMVTEAARRWLAEHPEDDGGPVNEDGMLALGFHPNPWNKTGWRLPISRHEDAGNPMLIVSVDEPEFEIEQRGQHTLLLRWPRPLTMGDVARAVLFLKPLREART